MTLEIAAILRNTKNLTYLYELLDVVVKVVAKGEGVEVDLDTTSEAYKRILSVK
ncbi:hypothetical protein TrRE_jg8526, partial [Triparma retinervis]